MGRDDHQLLAAGISQKLGTPSASIGLVADDPKASTRQAAQFLQSRGCQARVVLDAEPALPIAFVVKHAIFGTAINFSSQMPQPQELWPEPTSASHPFQTFYRRGNNGSAK